MTPGQRKQKNYSNRSKKIIEFKNLQKLSQKLKKEGRKIVFTTGSFDLLNPGHCRYLAEAKAKGDVLVVGVATDDSEKRLKGSLYPLIDQKIRAEVLSHLRVVDYVTYVDEGQPHAVLILLQPDIFFTSGGLWENGMRDEQEKFILKMYGGKLVVSERYLPYYSSQMLVEHIANIRVMQILEKYIQGRVGEFAVDPYTHLRPADFGEQIPRDKKAYDANSDITEVDRLAKLREKWTKSGKKVVFVSGSYDLTHVGHARFIEQASLQGDVLVVGIPSDRSIRELKGVGRPVISERSRAYVLNHFDYVDKVVIFDETTVLQTLEKLRPDVFFTVDEDWNKGYKKSPEYKCVVKNKGNIVRAPRQSPFLSASMIIDKAAQQKVRDIFKECMKEELYQKVLSETKNN